MAKSNNQSIAIKDEIRSAPMWELVWKLTPVAVIAMSINSINTFVDALFIGQFLGETALAGVSLAFPLSLLTNAFAAMIGVGGSSLLSIALGSNDTITQKKIFNVITILSLLAGAALTCVGWYFAEDLISAIGGKGEVLAQGAHYYRILILGAFFQVFAVVMNFLIRAEGKLKTAMSMSMASMLLNMILNPFFIGYLDMGIGGASLATIISMFFLLVMGLIYYFKGHSSYPIDHKYFKIEPEIIKPILGVGLSAMMLNVMFLVQNIVVFKQISIYGDDWDIAFMGACYRILLLMLIPGFGFSTAVQPVIGINYGAGDYQRVKRAFFVFGYGCIGITSFLLILFEIFPVSILSLLLPNSTFEASDIFNFRIMMAPIFMSSLFVMAIIMYQSIGKAKISGIMTVLREIVFFIPVVILLPRWLGITGIYVAPLVQNLTVLFIILYLLRSQFKEWDVKFEKGYKEVN